MPEAVEQVDLPLGVAAHFVVFRKVDHELAHARAELVREVGSCRADELVDVFPRRLTHGQKPTR